MWKGGVEDAEKEYYVDLAQSQGNPQAVWKDLNKIIGKGCKERVGTIQVNGHDITRNQDKAEEFNEYFVNCIPPPTIY